MAFTKSSIARFLLLSLFTFFLVSFSFAQLTVTPQNAASSLAQAIAGSGVTVSNASLNCGSSASGTFVYSGSNLGMTGGIILTTGNAADAANAGSYLCNVNNGNNFSDPDLTNIVSSANLDVCILEFDFIPTCNSLNMSFVFGSEEYPQGVGHYNDAFGIFLTGPDPSGGNYAAFNIATLPNTNPVSINNVNASTNSGYFHNNYTSPNNDIAYNGYTIPVTSTTPITPCSTYKMKIAIADGGNALYDSGVMINGNGVSCQVPATITASATPTGGCSSTGSASVSVSGFSGTVSYHWLPGGQTTPVINNLSSGTYSCVVSLNQTCGVITQTVTATVSASGGNLVLTSSQQNLTCNGATNGSATVTPIGGTAPYTCVWNTVPAQNGMTGNNLGAGTYSATVTDNSGCQSTIQINITAPPAMQMSFSTTAATCNGATGAASVNVTANGTAPYTYTWSTTPIQTTQSISNLMQGSYTVAITDSKGCIAHGVAHVSTQNPSWTLSAVTTSNITCYGGANGAVTANISNPGSSAFTYQWNTSPAQNSQSVSNLPAGNYTCTVTDNNGCVVSSSAVVTQPALLTASVTSAPTICSGSVGSVNATAIGGTAPYTYLWSNSQNTNSVQGLSQGQYSVTITDAHGCSTSSMGFVSVVSPTLQVTYVVGSSICGGPSGSISISSVLNGTAPYSFVWATGQTTQNLSNLSPGIYVVDITDTNGCSGSTSMVVDITNILPLNGSASPDYCDQKQGSASVMASGNPPYQYSWNTSPVQTTSTAVNLPAGNYMVHVTDAYNCKDSVLVAVINQNDLFLPVFSTQPMSGISSEELVTIDLSTNSGWVFDNGTLSDGTAIPSLSFDHIFAQQGDYTAAYYFTSLHGCKDSVTYIIHVKDEMSLYIPDAFTPNHDGKNDEFKAKGFLVDTFEMEIYDRWGNLVIKLNDINEGWNGKFQGKEAEPGTYVYTGIAANAAGDQKEFSGQINLIR